MAPARGRKWCGFRLWPKPVALPKPLDLDVLSASVRLGRLAVLKLAESLLKAFFNFFYVKACRSSGKEDVAHTHATCCTMVFPRPCVWKGWLC